MNIHIVTVTEKNIIIILKYALTINLATTVTLSAHNKSNVNIKISFREFEAH